MEKRPMLPGAQGRAILALTYLICSTVMMFIAPLQLYADTGSVDLQVEEITPDDEQAFYEVVSVLGMNDRRQLPMLQINLTACEEDGEISYVEHWNFVVYRKGKIHPVCEQADSEPIRNCWESFADWPGNGISKRGIVGCSGPKFDGSRKAYQLPQPEDVDCAGGIGKVTHVNSRGDALLKYTCGTTVKDYLWSRRGGLVALSAPGEDYERLYLHELNARQQILMSGLKKNTTPGLYEYDHFIYDAKRDRYTQIKHGYKRFSADGAIRIDRALNDRGQLLGEFQKDGETFIGVLNLRRNKLARTKLLSEYTQPSRLTMNNRGSIAGHALEPRTEERPTMNVLFLMDRRGIIHELNEALASFIPYEDHQNLTMGALNNKDQLSVSRLFEGYDSVNEGLKDRVFMISLSKKRRKR